MHFKIKNKADLVRTRSWIGSTGQEFRNLSLSLGFARSTIISNLLNQIEYPSEREETATRLLTHAIRACVNAYENGVPIDRIVRALDSVALDPNYKYEPSEDKDLILFLSGKTKTLKPLNQHVLGGFNSL